jgi:hypothetical protein
MLYIAEMVWNYRELILTQGIKKQKFVSIVCVLYTSVEFYDLASICMFWLTFSYHNMLCFPLGERNP